MYENSMARKAAMDQRRTPSKHDRFTRHKEYTQYRDISRSVYSTEDVLRAWWNIPSGEMGGLSSQLWGLIPITPTSSTWCFSCERVRELFCEQARARSVIVFDLKQTMRSVELLMSWHRGGVPKYMKQLPAKRIKRLQRTTKIQWWCDATDLTRAYLNPSDFVRHVVYSWVTPAATRRNANQLAETSSPRLLRLFECIPGIPIQVKIQRYDQTCSKELGKSRNSHKLNLIKQH